MTDTMGRMHSDAQFAVGLFSTATCQDDGSIGIGNNPMVGAAKRQGCATQLRYRS